MRLISGIQATIRRSGAEPNEQDVRTVLLAAFPSMMGWPGIKVEHQDGPDWLVTLPSLEWIGIEDAGHFEHKTALSDGSAVTLTIDTAY